MKSLKKRDRFLKRSFDLLFSSLGLIFFFIPILILVLISTISLGNYGLYIQKRIGFKGKLFHIYKIRTMKIGDFKSTITMASDPRISRFGKFLRSTKLDELPQLWNVLIGDMSLVGPRPDVPGYADKLTDEDRVILSVRPGITGPATLKYRNEEYILAAQKDPKEYNDDVIWQDKVEINKEYIKFWSFKKDIQILLDTFFS